MDFPLLDAHLLIGKNPNTHIGICTNTTSPEEVYGEIPQYLQRHVAVLGSLIVNRDGAERMIINTLAHPHMQYLILFAKENSSFRASTNLLMALMHGYQKNKEGNHIKNGCGVSYHYPSVSKELLTSFKKKIQVLPLYQSAHHADVIEEYMQWLKPQIDHTIWEKLIKLQGKSKIYYDALAEVLETTCNVPDKKTIQVQLNVDDFKHLQPPKILLSPIKPLHYTVPFRISHQNSHIRIDMQLEENNMYHVGDDPFNMSYNILCHLGEKKHLLTPMQQILLGMELSRANIERNNNLKLSPLCKYADVIGTEKILEQSIINMQADKKYYYKCSLVKDMISMQCMSFDTCQDVFDLRSKDIYALLERINTMNRFQDYAQDLLHRSDIGDQLYKAYIALQKGYAFMQDFNNIFTINTSNQPFVFAEGDSFLSVHRSLITKIFTEGITQEHADKRKGKMRAAIALAVFRNTSLIYFKLDVSMVAPLQSPTSCSQSSVTIMNVIFACDVVIVIVPFRSLYTAL